MRIHAQWTSPMRFRGTESASGAGIVMDARVEHGGGGAGPTPIETLLMALAGCTGMDVITILKKMRMAPERFSVEASAERASEHPKVFTSIHLCYRAAGEYLQPVQVEKAVALSQDKYCSVAAMLRHAVPITYEVIVEDVGVPAVAANASPVP